jgi:DNA-binding response OmpR family regulator
MPILVVEDEALIAMTLERILSDAGFIVQGLASTRDGAMEMAERHPPDIAFVNVRLRDGYTGVALARALREQFGTTVFFASGQSLDASDSQDAAAAGYLTKPYTPEAILAAVGIANGIRCKKRFAPRAEGVEDFTKPAPGGDVLTADPGKPIRR